MTYNGLEGATNHVNNVGTFTVENGITFGTPTKTGYTFNGWYTDSEFTTPITSTTGVYDDLVLYAKFTANHYIVTLKKDTSKTITYKDGSSIMKTEVVANNETLVWLSCRLCR